MSENGAGSGIRAIAEQAARLLREARRASRPIPALPDSLRPTDLRAGYAIQRAFVALSGDRPVGYKVGLTSLRAQEMLNVPEPLWGTVLAGGLLQSPASVDRSGLPFHAVEPEIAFEMASDLPARAEPYAESELVDAVAAVHPAIEVVGSAFGDAWSKVGAPSLAADNGAHGFLVLGERLADWRSLDLAGLRVRLEVNGAFHSDGVGANALGGPLKVLDWLANSLPEEGLHLRRGDVVTTGVVTGVPLLSPGDRAVARFEKLGDVQLSLQP